MQNKHSIRLSRPRRAILSTAAVCAAAFVLVVLLHPHPHFGFDGLTGFHGLLGAASAAGLIGLGRLLAAVLGRDDPPEQEEQEDHGHG
jgi:hypothetical protein